MEGTYYDILDVPIDASCETIREAYKKMAIKWHPDKNIDNKDEANARFKQISEAYQVLSDKTKRLRYDQGQNSDNYDLEDSDDDLFGSFFFEHFMAPEMLFFHIFNDYRQRGRSARHTHYNDFANAGRRHNKPEKKPRNETCSENGNCNGSHGSAKTKTSSTINRMVNGKRWTTTTYYEGDNMIVTRHEEGELISKHINGVPQSIPRK